MIHRPIIRITGPAGAGKTMLAEHLLGDLPGMLLAARCVRDDKLREVHESSPRRHPELDRYRKAGAAAVAEYRFPVRRADEEAFYGSKLMENYSEGVVLEGDQPLEYVDLGVFVAPAPAAGESLLCRVRDTRDRPGRYEPATVRAQLKTAAGTREFLAATLGRVPAKLLLADPARAERLRQDILATLGGDGPDEPKRRKPVPERWAISPGYAGIERAQLVVVNVRGNSERDGAAGLLAELVRLRKDEAVLHDVLGATGSRTPITAVAANLTAAADPGLKKALARVRRLLRSSREG